MLIMLILVFEKSGGNVNHVNHVNLFGNLGLGLGGGSQGGGSQGSQKD